MKVIIGIQSVTLTEVEKPANNPEYWILQFDDEQFNLRVKHCVENCKMKGNYCI